MVKGPAQIAHGPMFIGYSFNIVLYGIMITQVYLYFSSFKKDRVWMKMLVAGLLLADTVNAIFDAVYLYDSLIIHFDNVKYLGNATWDPALTALIAGTVQLFFAWRVKVLTTNWWMVLIVVIASLTGLIGGLITTYEVGVTPHFVNFRHFKWSVIMWLAGECFADLRKHKTGFQASDELVDRIIRLTVQTGLLTSLCAILDLIFFLCDPTGTHLIFNFPLAKLYTNSVMSSLNSRGAWNYSTIAGSGKLGDSTPNVITTGDIGADISRRNMAPPVSPSRIYVHVESHELRDIDIEANHPYDRASQAFKQPMFVNTKIRATDKQNYKENDVNSSASTDTPLTLQTIAGQKMSSPQSRNLSVTARHDVYPAISPETYFSGSSEAFRSKVVLVFGASKGVGLSISSFYTRAGAKLAMISRSEKALAVAKDQVISEAGSLKPDVLTVAADVADTKAVEEAVRQVIEAYGRLDIVIANAGISSPWTKPFVENDPYSDWWRTLEVNLRGTYNVAHYTLPHLDKTSGSFVAITSAASQVNARFASAYAVSKTALNRFVEYVAIEHPTVKSFSMHPGTIKTDSLPAATVLRLTDGSGRFDWLSGKFVSANWDLEEFERDWKEDIMNKGLLITRILVE
ncbi:hypothetical protein LENED_008743 [Lentinula edodes]|uniref:Ketoreductase domain-containing protein n=2 Tax=Lentinula edodes TaxID=5353 RepID=A0A1Q3EI24_LENED|nr:hypothetical protein LENED_008743 [Lentinula edodes]